MIHAQGIGGLADTGLKPSTIQTPRGRIHRMDGDLTAPTSQEEETAMPRKKTTDKSPETTSKRRGRPPGRKAKPSAFQYVPNPRIAPVVVFVGGDVVTFSVNPGHTTLDVTLADLEHIVECAKRRRLAA